MKVLFLVCLIGFSTLVGKAQNFTLESYITDSETGQPIAYATIYNLNKKTGSIGNLNGYFKLENVSPNDTLSIYFIGYEKYYEMGSVLLQLDTIRLTEKSSQLDEVTILADDSFLYELVAKSGKTCAFTPKTAKSYFELETYANGTQIELVESYYNGVYTGYDVEELNYKSGRLALKGFGQMLLTSTSTSRAILMHKLMEKNDYFPKMPFEFGQFKMRKYYKLNLASTYNDEAMRKIYVINFNPISEAYFSGTVWIDSLSHAVQKVKLMIKEATQYPFQLMGYPEGEGLTHVNLEITKSFLERDGKMYVDKIDFNYDFYYPAGFSSDSLMPHISSHAILYAYDYANTFSLPIFEFTDSPWIDYVQIFTIPPNQIFWDHLAEFSLNDADNSNELFYQSYGHDLDKSWFATHNDTALYRFDKVMYKNWSKNRIIIRETLNDTLDYSTRTDIPPSRLYHLEAQILLDINAFDDTVSITTRTVLDPYKTYYHFPIDKLSDAFVNLYFDLVEIQRMELEREIEKSTKDEATILALYSKRMELIKQMSADYFSEVNRGKNSRAFAKWNTYIYDRLGINNIEIFHLNSE